MLSWAQRLATFSHSAWIVGSFSAFRWCCNSTRLLVSSFFMVLSPHAQGAIRLQIRRRNMNSLQMRMPVQTEQTDGVLLSRLENQLHRVNTVGSDRQRVFHGAGELVQCGMLQQPQHLDELARAVLLQFGLLASTQHN